MSQDPAAAQRLAARVAGAADLLDVRLLEANTKLHNLATDGPLSFALKTDESVEHDEGEDFFVVRVAFSLEITKSDDAAEEVDDDGADEDSVATINFEYGALYDLVDLNGYEPSEAEFQAYAETSATMTLYPYAREFISSMTNRLGLPRLVLPTHRLPSPWHPESSQASEHTD